MRKMSALLLLLNVCLLTIGGSALGASQDPLLAAYLHARRALPQPALQAGILPSAEAAPTDYTGRVFELTAQVGGMIAADGNRVVLLSVGSLELPAHLPDDYDAGDWLVSGQTVRALIEVAPNGNDQSLSNLQLIAAAPESEVAGWEQMEMTRGEDRRAPSYPSRSLSYANQRRTTYTSGRQQTYSPSGAAISLPAGAGPIAPLSPRALMVFAPYWNAVRGLGPRLSGYDVNKITTSILYFSDHYDLDPRLVMAMIIAESGFDLHSTSRTGAMGLGQLMPETARGLGVTDAYDPVQNIAASVHILRGNLDKYGGAPAGAGVIPFSQIALTMAAYNAGSGAVRKFHGVPPYRETQRYVAKVTALYKRMCGLSG